MSSLCPVRRPEGLTASLRVLTCTGWEPDARAYRENVVVHAPRHDSAPK